MRLTTRLPTLLFAAALCLAGVARPALAAPPSLTAEEFKLWKDYVGALSDERVQKIPQKQRMAAIARNFKVKEKDLAAAVAKGEQEGPGAAKASEAEVRALFEASELKGLVTELRVDDTESHVVTYVAWKNSNGGKLEEEASLAALLVARGAPITSTVAVWAVDAASGRKVFEAKIAAETAGKFQEKRIPMFAQARYIRQFEDVRNAYKGTPPTDAAPATTPPTARN